jgi:pimeloyl-ACP methyl ester carboxylesterase
MATTIRRGYVRLPAGFVHLRYGGRGEPLVVLHDAGQSSAAAERHGLLSQLGDRFRVYAPDLPGHGSSDPLPGALTLEALASTILLVSQELGDRTVRLLGVGLGALVAAKLATLSPDFVSAAVGAFPPADGLADWQITADGQHLRERFAGWAARLVDAPNGLDEAAALTAEAAAAGHDGVRAAALRDAQQLPATLDAVQAPTLLVATLGDTQFDQLSESAASNHRLDLALAPAGLLFGAFDPGPFCRVVEDVF